MERTQTIKLAGRVLHMDEDAYELLSAYLQNVYTDILDLDEYNRLTSSLEVRLGEMACTVLAETGRPVLDNETTRRIISDTAAATPGITPPALLPAKRKYYREMDRAMICGVLSGLAIYKGWHLTTLRILFFFLFILLFWLSGFGWVMIPAYLSVWLLVPPAVTASQKLQLRGQPATINNIGRLVASEAEGRHRRKHSSFADNLGCLLRGSLLGGAVIGLIVSAVTFAGWLLGGIDRALGYGFGGLKLLHTPSRLTGSTLAALLVILLIPLLAMGSKRSPEGKYSGFMKVLHRAAIVLWFLAILTLLLIFINFLRHVGFYFLPFTHR